MPNPAADKRRMILRLKEGITKFPNLSKFERHENWSTNAEWNETRFQAFSPFGNLVILSFLMSLMFLLSKSVASQSC